MPGLKQQKMVSYSLFYIVNLFIVQFRSVAQSCPALCNRMDCSTPGPPVHYQLPESTQTHVHWVDDAIQPSHLMSSPSPPAFNLSQHQSLFKWVNSFHQMVKVLVKWALESFTMSKASGGDETPVELFQMLKDDAVKVLYSICQQIWKTQQWQQDWKRSVFIVSGLEI